MSLRHVSTTHFSDVKRYLHVHRWALWITIFSLMLIVLMTALSLWRLLPIVRENSYIPLHYNIYLGIDRFGPWYHVFISPVLGFAFLILNLSLAAQLSEIESHAFRFGRNEPILSRLLMWLTPVLELIFFTGVVFILLLNL